MGGMGVGGYSTRGGHQGGRSGGCGCEGGGDGRGGGSGMGAGGGALLRLKAAAAESEGRFELSTINLVGGEGSRTSIDNLKNSDCAGRAKREGGGGGRKATLVVGRRGTAAAIPHACHTSPDLHHVVDQVLVKLPLALRALAVTAPASARAAATWSHRRHLR